MEAPSTHHRALPVPSTPCVPRRLPQTGLSGSRSAQWTGGPDVRRAWPSLSLLWKWVGRLLQGRTCSGRAGGHMPQALLGVP